MNILIIEDDSILRHSVVHTLQSLGHSVLEAKNGKEGLDCLLEQTVDLILCDLMMPLISGVTFLNMQHKYTAPNTPIIVTSSLQEAPSILANLGIKYHSFLLKPFSAQQLTGCIDEVQEHHFNRFIKSTLTH